MSLKHCLTVNSGWGSLSSGSFGTRALRPILGALIPSLVMAACQSETGDGDGAPDDDDAAPTGVSSATGGAGGVGHGPTVSHGASMGSAGAGRRSLSGRARVIARVRSATHRRRPLYA
ncbi:hypothetical protein predicted by Glimmer/Critica [Sorangium cellulosum So ce56]|uniref:Uncharacterized protein n=1 Tax=Sorangium cellulosum (strain So ce56) TaxID=448385 RepID=A9GY93_SORC5|nr:hypothetical protein predicted by Glimmer/Critica [Sorangium cellulosum So ce56]